MCESLNVWIQIVAKFTSNLLSKQIEDGAEYLTHEHKQLNESPPFSFLIPYVIDFNANLLLLVEDSIHDCTEVNEKFDGIHHSEAKSVHVVVFW